MRQWVLEKKSRLCCLQKQHCVWRTELRNKGPCLKLSERWSRLSARPVRERQPCGQCLRTTDLTVWVVLADARPQFRTSFVFSFRAAIFPVVFLWFAPNLRGRWRDPASPHLLPIAWFESYFLMLNICVYVKKTLTLGYVLKHLSVCWGSFIYAVCFICKSSFPTFLILSIASYRYLMQPRLPVVAGQMVISCATFLCM